MSIKLIQPKPPIVRVGNTSDDVLNYDSDNMYPQRIWWLLAASNTGMAAANEMASNIVCDGFANQKLGEHLNAHNDSLNNILSKIAFDYARFGGYYLNVQYNALGKAVNVYHIPFEYVRIKLNDDYKKDSIVRAYKVFNNWERSSDLSNETKKATEYKAYNPDSVLAEIEEVGGIENYNGQILCVARTKFKGYPMSPFHTVQNHLNIEHLNSVYLMRQFSNGFKDCSIIEFEEIQGSDGEGYNPNEEFMDALSSMRGADAASSFLAIQRPVMTDQASVRRTDLSSHVDKDLYKAYLEPISKQICMAAENLPLALIDISVLGGGLNTSGSILVELRRTYRERLLSIRNDISQSLARVFGVSELEFQIDDKLNQVNNANNNGRP